MSCPALNFTARVKTTRNSVLAILFAVSGLLSVISAQAQQLVSSSPETALTEALSAACRQDSTAFANFLTTDNGMAYRALPVPQRTALMKRFVLLEDAGRALLSTSTGGRPVIRCEAPGISIEMRLGETRSRENLAFIPMEIPLPGEPARSITFGLVREGGNWKLLSVGLILLDISSMAQQWDHADLETREDNAIAALRKLASALETYRRAYGKLPETLESLGPPPTSGISPEAAGLVDAELSAGNKDGYAIRYRILPAGGNLPEEDANQAAKFELAATPVEYGKTSRRSFFLDSGGILHGADKQGSVATSADPRISSP